MQNILPTLKKHSLPIVLLAAVAIVLILLNVLTAGRFLALTNIMTIVVNALVPTFVA